MRFAWLREKAGGEPARQDGVSRVIFIIYNVVWWVPPVLGFTKIIDYPTAAVSFAAITVIRAVANVYRVNFLSLERAEVFPFRAP